jgi:hypothetical protein
MLTLQAAAEFLLDSLVESAVRGDTTATEWLLAHVRPQVQQYCAVRVPAESVDEVAQQVLLTLFHALPGYHNQGRPFLAFVLGIAHHKITTLQHDHPAPARGSLVWETRTVSVRFESREHTRTSSPSSTTRPRGGAGRGSPPPAGNALSTRHHWLAYGRCTPPKFCFSPGPPPVHEVPAAQRPAARTPVTPNG